jgi:hypothetical protein
MRDRSEQRARDETAWFTEGRGRKIGSGCLEE